MMSLMNSQSPNKLLEYATVNFINNERRKNHIEFNLLRSELSKIPFTTHHNVSALDAQENIPQVSTFQIQLILDTIHGLKICISYGLEWCLMTEEDYVVPKDLFDHLEFFVIGPLENHTDKLSVVSLYSYYNLVWDRPSRINLPKYSKTKYNEDREKMNSEQSELGMPQYTPH